MNYTEFKNYFSEHVFNNYMNGNIGLARSNIAAIYKQGTANPRATLYQMHSGMHELQDTFSKQKNIYEAAGNKEQIIAYKKAYLALLTDIIKLEHPMIETARNEMHEAYNKLYTNPKTKQLARFVMLKQQFPRLKNMKFLIRFL